MCWRRACLFQTFLLCLFTASAALRGAEPVERLAAGLEPVLDLLQGKKAAFAVTGTVKLVIDKTPAAIDLRLVRYDAESFDLTLTHPQYSVDLRRRPRGTALALPHHKKVFIGRGDADKDDHLRPESVLDRLISPDSQAATYVGWLKNFDSATAAQALVTLAGAKPDNGGDGWTLHGRGSLQFGPPPRLIELVEGSQRVLLRQADPGEPAPFDDWKGMSVEELDRRVLERQLVRGVRRATEVLAPAPSLTSPTEHGRRVPHGELRWIDHHRVVLLDGTPEQIGTAHGQLLREESIRCMDSVLYSFGTAQTILTGRWFLSDLEQAYARLAPFIPEDHKAETRALARSLELEPHLVETVNVFPEMFHCSGFAVFGTATQGGKLYHGRVLDYMTTIGLQDAATTFIVAPRGKIAFANVGYGGFIGSVSGMNVEAISLGEMGGRGEGKWDGVPMATLMRRALEECSTLDQVINLWKTSPRTCEYYYVFADGKSNRAVGVAAFPESVQFVQPGEAHPLLGEGIPDAVVLSAGDRLKELRNRVTSQHGKIDAQAAQGLMCRPVAMKSNLHNVLFVPADRVLYVANADHTTPAADRPYVRLDLAELLKSMPSSAPGEAASE